MRTSVTHREVQAVRDKMSFDLNGRLLEAQEDERRRLAQELHDDFSQRFALALIKLRTLFHEAESSHTRTALEEIIEDVTRLECDLQALSHRLYSPKLKIAGLLPNIVSLCTDVGRDRGLDIVCEPTNIPTDLSEKTVLALFRVVQEALHNVVKHSGASKVQVRLTGTPDQITLTIFDNGIGVDLERSNASRGLGVHSMRERVRTLGGVFQIDTRPSVDGTQITATVPATKRGGDSL